MKKKLIFLCILIFIVYILFFPQDAVTAAADGLVLWYERVLPSLLPYAILSNILIYSGFTGYLVKLLYPLLRLILPASRNGSFVLLSGFLFGFPMGSKNCAEMLAVRISGSRNTVYGDKQHQSCIYQQLYSLPRTSYAFPDTTQLSGNIFAASHCR